MTQLPSVGRMVHYVSYGTPNGEYQSLCRSAVITEVGAWMDVDISGMVGEDDEVKLNSRIVYQEWRSEACALEVHNPTGVFFNTCVHDEDKAPGTWHWPERVDN